MRRMIVFLMLIAGCGPRPDTREELEALGRDFNETHAFDVLAEDYDPRKHFTCVHNGFTEYFHRDCSTCATNCRVRCRKFELLRRHPEWRPGHRPPPPEPEETFPPSKMPEPASPV